MEKLINLKNKLLDYIYKYRFLFAIIIIILGVLFKLHGSSIGLWNTVFNTGIEDSSLLFGKPRSIRSDEWAVTTPLIISQSFNHFNYFSNILRGGTTTDAFSLYGLPVVNILEIFRPFHFGYLILGIERGLSFFWIARLVILFLVTFEFGRLLFNKDKRISVIAAFMVTLSPIVGWWFATNGTAEMFIYGQLALICLYKYMNTEKFKSRLLYLCIVMICAGGYVFILYPAFQIPVFFVILMLAIYIICTNYRNMKFSKKDFISILIMLLMFIGLMAYFFIMSKDTINTVLNTVYPASRVETGGGAFRKYISYLDNVFLPYKEEGIETHTAKEAIMFGLFPIGIMYACISMIKNKKIDLFTILLLIPYVIVGMFCFFELPEWFAKITLLSYSTPQRAVIVLGYIDILLLMKTLVELKSPKIYISIIIALVLSFALAFICKTLNPNYVGIILATFLFAMSFYLFFFALEYNTKYGKYLFTLGIIGTMIICEATINPISSGINVIKDSPILQAAKEINEKEDGIWVADALAFPCPNYLEMAGCKVVNATNIYPNLELWKSLDKENKYEDVYNRYAHVYMEVREKENITDKFVLITPDSMQVFITPEELKKMNIKYIFTVRVMEEFENENENFELIYNENNYHIYKVTYK